MNQLEALVIHRPWSHNTARVSVGWFASLSWLAFALLDLSILAIVRDPNQSALAHPEWSTLEFFHSLVRGAVFGQVAIVAFVTAWAPASTALKILGGGACLWGLAHLGPINDASHPELLGGLFFHSFVVVVFLGLARLAGLRMGFRSATELNDLTRIREPRQTVARSRAQSDWQFSVRSLLSITTAAAIAISLVQYAEFPFDNYYWTWPVYLLLALGALVAIIGALYSWRSSARAVTFIGIVTIVIAAFSIGFFLTKQTGNFGPADLLTNCIVAGAAALVLRVSGLRLEWRSNRFSGRSD